MPRDPLVTGGAEVAGDPIRMAAPDLTAADEEAVVRTLRSGVLSLGPAAEEFERRCAAVAGTAHAVAVSSGTAGLHLIVRALGIGPGDEVLVPSFTFAASVNAIVYEGATPVFVDIEPETYCIDPAAIAANRTPRTKAAMVIDVFGQPAGWDAIAEAAEGLALVDDACEAIGARDRGRPAGGFGDAGCFAFYPNKQITTGEGGMIVTDDASLATRCRSMRNQGRGAMGAWLEHEELGFNYRLDELSAALGVSQISRLDELLRRRAAVASLYDERLAGIAWLRPPVVRAGVEPSWFVYVVTLAPGIARDAVVAGLAERGVPSRAYFAPMHRQPSLAGVGRAGPLGVTDDVAPRTLALPFHGGLSAGDVDRVVSTLTEVVERGGSR